MSTRKGLATAVDRTVSLFTGLTDLEKGHASRDGSNPDPPSRTEWGSTRKVRWQREEDLSSWYSVPDKHCRIERDRGGNYNVRVCGVPVGSFDNICAAADAAERRR